MFRNSIVLLLLFSLSGPLPAQKTFQYNRDDLATLSVVRPKGSYGFEVSLSLVAAFTCGSIVRDGFRWGAGMKLSQHLSHWTLSTGLDCYKETKKFAPGIAFIGTDYYNGRTGFSYYCTRYFQGDPQTSGIVRLRWKDAEIGFEDDILSLPFTGFTLYDRFRTAALEVKYKGILIGTNVYTNDADGLTDASSHNSKGIYLRGRQLSSPLYAGYESNGLTVRLGMNNALGGIIGQNWWHQQLFQTTDFQAGEYNKVFFQAGTYKPYTLY